MSQHTKDYDTIEKLYWHISEVAVELNVSHSCLRFWEDEFSLRIKHDALGKRYYTRENVDELREIHRLLKVERYTLEGARVKFHLFKNPPPQSN